MQEKIYECICGQTFDNPQKFNGHKSHCRIHLEAKGTLSQYLAKQAYLIERGVEETLKRTANKKRLEKEAWLSENHICEKCGNLILEKFGSGRFCSRKCANSRSRTEESKARTAKQLKKFYSYNSSESESSTYAKNFIVINGSRVSVNSYNKYNLNPKKCPICNSNIDYLIRGHKTCGNPDCVSKLRSIKSRAGVAKHGGNNNPYGVRTCKYGTYKGFHCDSSYELAFVIYCLDHDINIERNNRYFPYYYKGKLASYYPDFVINNTYIEIKNYMNSQVEAKIRYFPNELNYKILFKNDLQACFEYCESIYGKNWITLYDRNYPSWMDRE